MPVVFYQSVIHSLGFFIFNEKVMCVSIFGTLSEISKDLRKFLREKSKDVLNI